MDLFFLNKMGGCGLKVSYVKKYSQAMAWGPSCGILHALLNHV